MHVETLGTYLSDKSSWSFKGSLFFLTKSRDLIHRALDARQGTDGLQIKYKDFQARGLKAVNQWMETGKLQVDTMSKTVDDEVNHLLEEAIAEVIKDFKFIFGGYIKTGQERYVSAT